MAEQEIGKESASDADRIRRVAEKLESLADAGTIEARATALRMAGDLLLRLHEIERRGRRACQNCLAQATCPGAQSSLAPCPIGAP